MELDMNRFKEDEVMQENQAAAKPAEDGIDRRNFLGCMAWAGTGLLWSMVGGVPTSKLLAQTMKGGGAGIHEHALSATIGATRLVASRRALARRLLPQLGQQGIQMRVRLRLYDGWVPLR